MKHTAGDADLLRLSERNPGWRFERDDAGRGIITGPKHSRGGAQSGAAFAQLFLFAREFGGMAFDSSSGFTMSTGAVRSPDASWISRERLGSLSAEQQQGYWRICPDVVIEIASETDRWADLREKIKMYEREGAQFAIAIDPRTKATFARGDAPAALRIDLYAICTA